VKMFPGSEAAKKILKLLCQLNSSFTKFICEVTVKFERSNCY
jgi:hypothetical protein